MTPAVVADASPLIALQQIGSLQLGTLGVLLAAKRRGHLGAIRPAVAALRDHGFWVADTLIEQVLAAADEL